MDSDPLAIDAREIGLAPGDVDVRTGGLAPTRAPARSLHPRSTRRPPNSMRDVVRDDPLVQRARAGDREAFDELVRLHFERVHALLHRMLDNREDAEDLAQESFVRAYRALPGFRGDASFGTWVQRIAVHLAVAHHRRRDRGGPKRAIVDDELAQPMGLEPSDEHGRGELESELSRALDRLPANLRAAIVLRTVEEREYPELADMLGIRPATARTHVMQARKLLVRWLAPWLERGP